MLEESQRSGVSRYLTDLLELLAFPPYRGRWIDWAQVAVAAGVHKECLQAARHQLQPVFDAVSRAVAMQDVAPDLRSGPDHLLKFDKTAVAPAGPVRLRLCARDPVKSAHQERQRAGLATRPEAGSQKMVPLGPP